MATDKTAFFRDLDSLGYASDDDDDDDEQQHDGFTKVTQGTAGDFRDTFLVSGLSNYSLQRQLSSLSKSSENMELQSSAGGVNNSRGKRHESEKKKRPAESSRPDRPSVAKKTRANISQSIPESGQIFKGLCFFFIPNNDICRARRLRIQRSLDYGASWTQTWSENVTHVIVDKGLDYKEVLKVLTPEQLSVSIIQRYARYL